MHDCGYNNFYTPYDYESYQQYQQSSSIDERESMMEDILNVFMEQSVINMQNTKRKLKNLSCTLEMMSAQLAFLSLNMESQINTKTIMEDQDDNPSDDEVFKKSLGEDVEEEAIEL